jgi:Tol biopolymer transport system component
MNPAWSPDGRYVAYNGSQGIYRKATNGAAPEELLLQSHTLAVPKSWSPDGRYLIYAQINPGTGADLFALPIGPPDPHPLVLAQTQATEDQEQFSPDGHWVAYTSNESGQSEIYVISFPPAPNEGRWVVSRGGSWAAPPHEPHLKTLRACVAAKPAPKTVMAAGSPVLLLRVSSA